MNLKKINNQLHLSFTIEKKATRQGFGDAMVELAAQNKNILALTADLTSSLHLDKFQEKFPQRFLNVGVAEQNLVTVSSGLAAMGKIPFATSFAVFSPGRCWEQIRTTICYNNRNVKIVGSHTGVSAGKDGATHQALEDIALMRVLPNMAVIVPADYEQTILATKAIAKHLGPAYLRLARDKTPQITTTLTPFQIGQAQVLKDGKDLLIISAGPILFTALEVAEMLENKTKPLSVMVINSHTIKPLDEKTILAAAKKCKKIITVEEHQLNGGLGSAIAELLSEHPFTLKRFGFKDHFGCSGEPQEILTKAGLSKENIYRSTCLWLGVRP